MIDLSNLNLQDLRQLQVDISSELAKRDVQDIEVARDAIYKIAHDRKWSIQHLLEVTGLVKGSTPVRANASTKPAKEKAAPKYRNPANPDEEWTGRGRQPGWIKKALGAGVRMETLLINQ